MQLGNLHLDMKQTNKALNRFNEKNQKDATSLYLAIG